MSVPNTSELDDDQIEALIRKLSAIKGSAPELIAALEAEANSRIASKSSRSGRSGNSGRNRGGGGARQTSRRSPTYEDEVDDDDDDDDEETDSEEDDEFDEDGPCVGYGYSDEVSVISEMTTPTVVSNIHVPDEERYDEIRQGYGKQKSNKPDLLSQVNRVNAAKTKGKGSNAGLDAQRRKTYTSGLGKISETTEAAAVTKPKTKPTKKAPQRKGSGDLQQPPSRKAPSNRGLSRRDKSPPSKPKKSSSKKSSSSSKSKTKADDNHADAFGDDWHKSLTNVEGAGMDDNGFPFSFADTDNAFAASSNSFFKHKSGGDNNHASADPFDPFANGDGFGNFGDSGAFGGSGAAKPKTKSTSSSSRPRRASAMDKGSSRSKSNRDQSPRRKGGR